MSSLEGWSLACQEQKVEGLWAGDQQCTETSLGQAEGVAQEKEDQPSGPSFSLLSIFNTQCLGNWDKVWAPSLFVRA